MSTYIHHVPAPTTSDVWNDVMQYKVEKDDPLWKEYVEKAAMFDERMIDEWNKIVDVILVYVALFISVLTSFITQTSTQTQRDPADITNELLFAIYNQLANNTFNPPADPDSSQSRNPSKLDYDNAVTFNALLYISLSLCIVVSVAALVAKLWLVSYSHQALSVGSPYDRAMKRQEAYNGILVWNMGAVINILPLILLIAVILFGIFVGASVGVVEQYISYAVGAILSIGLSALGAISLGAAFIPGCPFRSTFSTAIRLIFESPQTLSKRFLGGRLAQEKIRWLWIGSTTFLWVTLCAVTAYATLFNSNHWISLVIVPSAFAVVYAAQKEVAHKPQQYKVSRVGAWLLVASEVTLGIATYFSAPRQYSIFLPLYILGLSVIIFGNWMASQMSKSMAETGEIDAIAWLLRSTPSQDPALFKKAGQLTNLLSNGRHYRARLLDSLLPLLSLLIISHQVSDDHNSDSHSPSSKARQKFKTELKRGQSDNLSDGRYRLSAINPNLMEDDDPIKEASRMQNLEIYVTCLAQLSDFTDYEGSFWCLKEDARRHPKLEEMLIKKLMVLANPRYRFQASLRSVATKVLNNYQLDIEGNPLTAPYCSEE